MKVLFKHVLTAALMFLYFLVYSLVTLVALIITSVVVVGSIVQFYGSSWN